MFVFMRAANVSAVASAEAAKLFGFSTSDVHETVFSPTEPLRRPPFKKFQCSPSSNRRLQAWIDLRTLNPEPESQDAPGSDDAAQTQDRTCLPDLESDVLPANKLSTTYLSQDQRLIHSRRQSKHGTDT